MFHFEKYAPLPMNAANVSLFMSSTAANDSAVGPIAYNEAHLQIAFNAILDFTFYRLDHVVLHVQTVG